MIDVFSVRYGALINLSGVLYIVGCFQLVLVQRAKFLYRICSSNREKAKKTGMDFLLISVCASSSNFSVVPHPADARKIHMILLELRS